ncbi:MAG TPA: hypothetical protein VL691_09745 [Vicinamibacteria bacterium]|nr:hypothetical protein [Vicinamibacteria bacterium]
MKASLAVILACLLPWPAEATPTDRKPAPAVSSSLTEEHWNASRTLSLRTPATWEVRSEAGQPEMTEARGDGLVLRLVRREGELGLDSFHAECMLLRLAGAMDASPQVDYEYDFVGAQIGDRKTLDSAFVVHYDEAVQGHRDWRQRNLTVVGGGESVCVVAYAPLPVWKKSKPARTLLGSVVESVRFGPWH